MEDKRRKRKIGKEEEDRQSGRRMGRKGRKREGKGSTFYLAIFAGFLRCRLKS